MDERTREPRKITAEDINPRYNWGRHLPALGTMGVDFEERVDYRRMHRYRLARAQAGLDPLSCSKIAKSVLDRFLDHALDLRIIHVDR